MNVTQEERHNKGLCIACGDKLGRGKWQCNSCMDKVNVAKRHSREVLLSLNLCTTCGKNQVFADEKMCLECRAKAANYQSRFCDDNRDFHNARSNASMKKMRENRKLKGLCVRCGESKADEGYTSCQWCRKKTTQKAIAYNHRTGKVQKVYCRSVK